MNNSNNIITIAEEGYTREATWLNELLAKDISVWKVWTVLTAPSTNIRIYLLTYLIYNTKVNVKNLMNLFLG